MGNDYARHGKAVPGAQHPGEYNFINPATGLWDLVGGYMI